jgi:integrase/recombinase XerD
MNSLLATRDIRKVALWLGHSSLRSTEIYLRADPTEKLNTIEAALPPDLRRGVFRSKTASSPGSPARTYPEQVRGQRP